MQAFIDFLVNNYLWFIIISIVLIFALIGYLVDTNDRIDGGVKVAPTSKPELPKMAENIETLNMSQDEVNNNVDIL